MISVIRTLPERHAPRAARVLRAPGQTVATSVTLPPSDARAEAAQTASASVNAKYRVSSI